MHERLVINKFLRLRRLELIIKDEAPSVIIGIDDDDFLYLCLNLTNNIPKGMFMKFMIIEIIIYPICRIFFHKVINRLSRYIMKIVELVPLRKGGFRGLCFSVLFHNPLAPFSKGDLFIAYAL